MKETENETGGLILNQYGVRGAWSQHEEDGGQAEAGLTSTNMVCEVRGLSMKEAEARTRSEGLSSMVRAVSPRLCSRC